MKLTTTAQVSVDGVMQGPGGPEEDEHGRFERGGWAHFDDEASTVMDEIYQRADAFLFGRRTYETFAGSWGSWADWGDSPIRQPQGKLSEVEPRFLKEVSRVTRPGPQLLDLARLLRLRRTSEPRRTVRPRRRKAARMDVQDPVVARDGRRARRHPRPRRRVRAAARPRDRRRDHGCREVRLPRMAR